jgi:UDP-N-acetylglucosamine acyltransferase
MSQIHPTAIVESGAQIASNVTIGAYSIIGKNCKLCEGVSIREHVVIDGYTTIGENTTIFPGAVIGTKTQDLKYKGEITYVNIGKNCQIREFVTINSSCGEGTEVKVGDGCLIMAYCHIAHNCEVGNRVIMSNNATLAGHVIVEDFAIISGLTAVHQYSRIGSYAMVGGLSRVTHDVPPYTIGAGIPYRLGGLNLVGLKRNNFPLKTRQLLSQAFRYIFRSGLSVQEGIEQIESDLEPIPEIAHFINFFRTSKRGVIDTQGIKEGAQKDLEPSDELEIDLLSSLRK